MASENTLNTVKAILADALGIGDRVNGYHASTELLGVIPEFDSMAVVSVLTMVEERYDVEISDDEIDAEIFATVGSLSDFVESKVGA